MTPYFLDTSVLVKRYVSTETGSGWVQRLFDPTHLNVFFVSSLAVVELASAMSIKARRGEISDAERDRHIGAFWATSTTFQVVEVDPLVHRAVDLVLAHGLRAYDAVQLAAGLKARQSLPAATAADFTFLSADTHLLTAATAEWLRTDDPNQH